MTRKMGERMVLTLLALACAAVVTIPIGLMLLTSLKSRAEVFSVPLRLFPSQWQLGAYVGLWTERGFGRFMVNSLVVALSATCVALVVAVAAGYGFSRHNFRGRHTLLLFVLLGQMVPATVLVIPFFRLLGNVGLYNTYVGLIAAHASFAAPFATWMTYGFFRAIPTELDDAARVDGCGPLRTLLWILFPLLRPGLVAVMMFSFLQSWNEYLFALSLAANERMFTVPVGIGSLFGEYGVGWNEVMAASTLGALPVVAAYLALEPRLTGGLLAGAVRG